MLDQASSLHCLLRWLSGPLDGFEDVLTHEGRAEGAEIMANPAVISAYIGEEELC